MLSNADWKDVVYMSLGTLGGIATGLSLPAFNFLFGEILNTLNSTGSNFSNKINTLCIYFAIIAAINLVSGFLQVHTLVLFLVETSFYKSFTQHPSL